MTIAISILAGVLLMLLLASEVAYRRSLSADKVACMNAINELRADEAWSVEIACDNADGTPNNVVEVSGDWSADVSNDHWRMRRFEGETLLAALQAAVAAKRALARSPQQ